MMFLLQSGVVEVGTGVVSVSTLALVLNLTFKAGRQSERVDGHEKRLDKLEKKQCPHPECPLQYKVEENG